MTTGANHILSNHVHVDCSTSEKPIPTLHPPVRSPTFSDGEVHRRNTGALNPTFYVLFCSYFCCLGMPKNGIRPTRKPLREADLENISFYDIASETPEVQPIAKFYGGSDLYQDVKNLDDLTINRTQLQAVEESLFVMQYRSKERSKSVSRSGRSLKTQ
jgi:hypothetical protein